MKTHEEIKRGLGCHAVQWYSGECPDHKPGCEGCPYENDYHDPDELMADALALIEELQAKVPQWISVEERLPEKEGKYIVCTAKGSVYCAKFSTRHGPGFHTDMYTHITHWMPLPKEADR